MAFIDNSQVTDDAAHRANGPTQPETADLLGIVRRGWLLIVARTTLGLSCALLIISLIPPNYKASSRITFERTLSRYMQTNKVTNDPIIDGQSPRDLQFQVASARSLDELRRPLL